MNNGYRALIRVLLTAGAFMLLPHVSFLGFAFHGTFLGALALAAIFEVVLWVTVVVYGIGMTATLGVRPHELPIALNLAVFVAVGAGFLKLASHVAPSLLTLAGILPALAGALVLLIISGTVMLRKRSCCCDADKDESHGHDESTDESKDESGEPKS